MTSNNSTNPADADAALSSPSSESEIPVVKAASEQALMNIAVALGGVLLVAAILNAVLTEAQSDYLGSKSEAGGGFDASVFPPFSNVTWLLAMSAPVALGLLLGVLVTLRVRVGHRSRRREHTPGGPF